LDKERSGKLGKLICQRGPALITAIPKGAVVLVYDGPPWEADSCITDELTGETLAAGGAWIDRRAFLAASGVVTIRIRRPVPLLVALRAKRAGAGFTERVIRMLDRIDVQPTVRRSEVGARQLLVTAPLHSVADLRRVGAAFGFSVRVVPQGAQVPPPARR